MSTTQDPNNFVERTIFGSLLITCLVYSGYFYSVILDIIWLSEPEISNLKELNTSSLTLMMNNDLKFELECSFDPLIADLADKSVLMEGNGLNSDCWRYLIDYQNVSCLFDDAEYVVNSYEARKTSNVKILPETVFHSFCSWESNIYSPYLDRFSQIIQRASESGLLKDYLKQSVALHNTSPPGNVETKTVFLILAYVSIIGYSVSIIIFLLEIFMVNFRGRMDAFYMRFRFGN